MNRPDKLDCYITLDFAGDKLSSLLSPFISYKENKCCKYDSLVYIHNTKFSSQFNNETKKLECYNTLGQKGLPGPKSLADWAHL